MQCIKYSIKEMEYIHNHFLSSNKDNIEHCNLESGERHGKPGSSNIQTGVGDRLANASIYPTLLEPGLSNRQMEVGGRPNTSTYPTQPAAPNYSHSFPTSDTTSNIHPMVSTDSMQFKTSGVNLQLLSPAEVEIHSNTNKKCSWHQDQAIPTRFALSHRHQESQWW